MPVPFFLGSINLSSYSPHLTTLRRTIGDYLSHGTFCSLIPATSYLDDSSLTDHHLMPLPLALHTIQMKTPRSPTGFGSQNVQLLELFNMMGFPSWMKLASILLHHIPVIPVYIITRCLQPFHLMYLTCPLTLPTHLLWNPPTYSTLHHR